MHAIAYCSLCGLGQQRLGIAQQRCLESPPALKLCMPDRGRELESDPSHLHHRLTRRRSAAHDKGNPHCPFTPDHTRCGGWATGWCEDQRYQSGGRKIQARRGTVWFIEHSTQRPCHWLEVRQQARYVLLRECGEQTIVS